MDRLFDIVDERVREYKRFNASGTQITVRLKPPEASSLTSDLEEEEETRSETSLDPVNHFLDSINALFDYALRDVEASDMVGITIRNLENRSDKPIGFSFRRRDQIASDVIWSLFEKVSQSNARFNALDKLVVDVQIVEMPVGYGRTHRALKTKGRPVSELAYLKRSIV